MKELRDKKIARVSHVPYFLVTQLQQQIEHLASLGTQVYILTSDGPELSRFRENSNIHFELIDISRSISPVRDVLALIKLFFFFRRHRFDIIHSTTPKAGLLTAVAGYFARCPVRLHTFTGQPWVHLTGPMRHIAKGADKIIGTLNTLCYTDSASQAQFLIEQKVVNNNKLKVIGKGSIAGVDLSRFDPGKWTHTAKQQLRQKLNIPVDSFVILFIGRITRDKGIFELVESFQNLLQNECNIHLILVGPLDEESGGVSSVPKEIISDQPGILYVGYSDFPENYMAIADILCLPSYREGFGTVVIEAAAMELATVGTDIYGLSDSIVNGKTGLLVPPRDVDSLTSTLLHLYHDREKCCELGISARKRVEQHFDSQLMNKLISDEYCRLLKQTD